MSDLTVAHDEIAMPFEDYQKLLRSRDLLAEALDKLLGAVESAEIEIPARLYDELNFIGLKQQARAALAQVEGEK